MTRYLVCVLFLALASAAALESPSGDFDLEKILASFDADPTGEQPWTEIQDRLLANIKKFVANGGEPDSYNAIVVIIATLQVHYNESVIGFSVEELDRLKLPSYYFNHNLFAVAKYYDVGPHTAIGNIIYDFKFQTTMITSFIWVNLASGPITATRAQTFACIISAFFSVQTEDKPHHFIQGGRFVIPAGLKPAVQKVNAALRTYYANGEDIKQLKGAEAIIEKIEKNELSMEA